MDLDSGGKPRRHHVFKQTVLTAQTMSVYHLPYPKILSALTVFVELRRASSQRV